MQSIDKLHRAQKSYLMAKARRDDLLLKCREDGYTLVSIGRVIYGQEVSRQRVLELVKSVKNNLTMQD